MRYMLYIAVDRGVGNDFRYVSSETPDGEI